MRPSTQVEHIITEGEYVERHGNGRAAVDIYRSTKTGRYVWEHTSGRCSRRPAMSLATVRASARRALREIR